MITSSSRPCFASLLALFCVSYPPYILVLAADPPHYLFLPISLNSLDLAGARLLSPRGSQILPKPACRCRGYRADDATKLKEELDEDLALCVVSF